jgi:hypothetical protein
MTEHNDARSTSMVPILNVSDSRAAPDFYRDQLEFEIRWEWGEPVDHACVAIGDAERFLCENG